MAERGFQEQSVMAHRMEADRSRRDVNEHLANYVDTPVTINGQQLTVLARRGFVDGVAATGAQAPWTILKLAGRSFRIFPSAIWDGVGHAIWPTWEGEPSIAESFFDIPLPDSPNAGFIYLECTVDDSDDYHGILETARIGRGAAVPFYDRSGTTVNIPLASYFLTSPGEFTLDAIRAFAFTLRRFGPPDSRTWDITNL